MSQDSTHVVPANVSAAEFGAPFQTLRRWGRWAADDERGPLHFLTPARVVAAAGLVREGVSVTLSLPANTVAAVHNPKPADHHMTAVGRDAVLPPIHFLKDFVGVDCHNDGHTHIDALCHVGYHGLLYGGKCETVERWEFLFIAAPLRIVGGTGSPINPLAVF